MFKEKGFIISIIVVVVVLIIGFAVFGGKKNSAPNSDTLPSVNNSQTGATAPVSENSNQSPTITKAPDVAVPDVNSTNLPKNIAKPETVIPTGSASIRIFEIKAEGGKFTPDTLIVNNRDTVKIKLTSVDKDYDFTLPFYGLKYVIEKSKTADITFSVSNQGKIPFYCTSCGGPDKGPVGYLIIK